MKLLLIVPLLFALGSDEGCGPDGEDDCETCESRGCRKSFTQSGTGPRFAWVRPNTLRDLKRTAENGTCTSDPDDDDGGAGGNHTPDDDEEEEFTLNCEASAPCSANHKLVLKNTWPSSNRDMTVLVRDSGRIKESHKGIAPGSTVEISAFVGLKLECGGKYSIEISDDATGKTVTVTFACSKCPTAAPR